MNIKLTPDQSAALDAIKSFLLDDKIDAFILRGSAGTGKTTLIARAVEELEGMNLSFAVLAPTGRAARILGNKIAQITGREGYEASTIHRVIYALTRIEINEMAETANDPGVRMIFPIREEEPLVSLFIIDESSMVGDKKTHGDFLQFGSGRLLKDIVTYSRERRPGRHCDHITKILFVGDPAQLPPVGEKSSPALMDDYLGREFNLNVKSFDITSVMRQATDSAILERATELRHALLAECFNAFSLQPNQKDIIEVDAKSAVDLIVESIEEKQSVVAVVHSNAKALEYNRNVRERRWGDAGLPIQVKETLLVNRNSPTHLMSNGDLIKVTKVGSDVEVVPVPLRGGHLVELYFRAITVAFRGSDDSIIETHCLALENLLDSPFRELTPLEQRALLVDFRKRHPDLNPKSAEFRRVIVNDPYFNALQVKYGYAMTCHKAQGGEWDMAIVDFESNAGARNPSFFRWAYTAITRAAKKLVLVNPPEFSAISDIYWERLEISTPEKANDSIEKFQADRDWSRLSFSLATAPLMEIHQQLRAVWDVQGIHIEQLQHLQYCERYRLERGGRHATVQYYYNGKHRISRVGLVTNVLSDDQLANAALTSLSALVNKHCGDNAQSGEFIQDFLARIDAALVDSKIKRIASRAMPYRLRVTVADSHRRGEIDFTYDGSSTWKSAQEVGGPGSTNGLYDEIQSLMASGQENAT